MLDASELLEAVGGGDQSEPDEDIIGRLRFDESLDVPIQLTDLDVWSNYVNDDLYVMDKKMREFFNKTRKAREEKGGYRTTASAVFTWIFGRKPGPADSYACRIVHRLLEYYCTEYTGKTTYGGKKVNRVYRFSKYATRRKRPYSLRLRLEEAREGNDPWRKSPDAGRDKRAGR